MMGYDSMEMEIIRLGLRDIERRGLSAKEVLKQSVIWLGEKYEMTKDERYLDKAVGHIHAYLEMGYPYENGEKEFQVILDMLGQKVEDVFPKRNMKNEKVPLRKSRINQLLGKWNPGLHSMKIADAVDDIIDKSLNRQIGEYTYHCGKVIKQNGNDALWEKTFKLYVREDEVIFQDVNQGQYYMLGE